jgi:DNA repair protein RecO (recombination protein O)
MARIEKTDAITLRTIPFRETSLLIHFFTRDFGKITVLAKGIRNKKPYVLSHFEPFVYQTISFYDNPRREIHILADSAVKEFFPLIRLDLDMVCAASYIVELIEKVSIPHAPHEDIFDLCLYCLCELKDMPIKKMIRYFEIKVLSLLGLFPNLEKCVICQQRWRSGKLLFSSQHGGMVCQRQHCQAQAPDVVEISLGLAETMKYIQSKPLEEFNRFSFMPQYEIEMQRLIQLFMEYHLNVQLRTLRFYRDVKEGLAL